MYLEISGFYWVRLWRFLIVEVDEVNYSIENEVESLINYLEKLGLCGVFEMG